MEAALVSGSKNGPPLFSKKKELAFELKLRTRCKNECFRNGILKAKYRFLGSIQVLRK